MAGIAFDNDIFCKLVSWGLLQETLVLFETTATECFVLPDLARQLKNPKSKLARSHATRLAKLIAALSGFRPVPDAAVHWQEKMLGVHDFDSGEARLFAFAAETDVLLLATGDKRALVVAPQVVGLCDAMRGRVIVLECVMQKLCLAHGNAAIAQAVNACPVDGAMALCFASSGNISEGLASHFRDLERNTDPQILLR